MPAAEETQAAIETNRTEGLWRTLREAVSGADRDYTTGSLPLAVLLLSVPMVLEMAMESLFGVLDTLFVGRLGSDAVAAVGVTEALLTVIFAVAIGLGMSTTAMVARRIGEKDEEAAAVTAVQAIVLGILLSLPVAAAGLIGGGRLLALLGAPPSVVAVGGGYAAWVLGGSTAIFMLFLVNAIFRGAGDASIAMKSLWIANAVNIVLDPCLIFGLGPFPELGLTGAGIGTAIGRTVGVVYQIRALAGKGRIAVRRRHLKIEWPVLWQLWRVSIGGIGQFLIATASWMALMSLLAPFGSVPLAGYTIALRIIVVALLPSWGMSNAAATLVGQNLGAGQPDRAERAVWLTGIYNMIFLGSVALIFITFAEPLVGLFSPDPQVRAMGALCLRIVSYGYVFYGWGMVMVQGFNGAGDTVTPTRVNFFCYWMFQIPLAWGLSRGTPLGPVGVFLAVTIAESVLAVVAIVCFRRGTWKTRTV